MKYTNAENEHHTESLSLYQMDCMELLKQTPNNYFDLAITDPPYGIGESGGSFRGRKGQNHRVLERKNWDNETPEKKYFDELRRVSENQIIWGGNYFTDKLPVSRCWIYWDKLMGGDFSDGELAWTSFDKVLKKYTLCNKMHGKIHPTQKDIKLYNWVLGNYAEKGQKILDTHLGSMSSAIACHYYGAHLTGCELDADYFKAGIERVEAETRQLTLF